jgi:hypothetical protein
MNTRDQEEKALLEHAHELGEMTVDAVPWKEDIGHYSKTELLGLVGDMSKEIVDLIKEKEDLAAAFNDLTEHKNNMLDLSGAQVLAFEEEIAEIKANHVATIEKLQLERQLRESTENKLKQAESAWKNLYELLVDSKLIARIRGWYWHTEARKPVYVTDMTMHTMLGYSIDLFEQGSFSASTDVFDPRDLVRIDVNLEFEL